MLDWTMYCCISGWTIESKLSTFDLGSRAGAILCLMLGVLTITSQLIVIKSGASFGWVDVSLGNGPWMCHAVLQRVQR